MGCHLLLGSFYLPSFALTFFSNQSFPLTTLHLISAFDTASKTFFLPAVSTRRKAIWIHHVVSSCVTFLSSLALLCVYICLYCFFVFSLETLFFSMLSNSAHQAPTTALFLPSLLCSAVPMTDSLCRGWSASPTHQLATTLPTSWHVQLWISACVDSLDTRKNARYESFSLSLSLSLSL